MASYCSRPFAVSLPSILPTKMKRKYTNNYDKIAPVYDLLSRLVYFNAQRSAQINQLIFLQPNSRILIIGGGTGWILEAITKRYNAGLEIVYVEISRKMMQLAKSRNYGNNQVLFLEKDLADYHCDTKFDVVMTAFLFDNFTTKQTKNAFPQIDSLLGKSGLWLYCDFYLNTEKGKWWKSAMIKMMYFFFRTFGMVETNNLIDMYPYFAAYNYTKKEESFYYHSFIQSIVYTKV